MKVSIDQIQVQDERDKDLQKESSLGAAHEEAEALEKRLALVEKEIKARGLAKFFELRNRWSTWIIIWISGLIVFNCGLAVAVGVGWLDFLNYQWFIMTITVETFLQIFGMGYVAVRFLFKDPSD